MIYRLAITNGFLAISNAAQPAPDKLMPKRIVSMQYPVLALLATMQGKITLIATVSQHARCSKFASLPGRTPSWQRQPRRLSRNGYSVDVPRQKLAM